MKELYLKIQEAFAEKKYLFEKYNVPSIKYIDLYRGQPLSPERFELYALPAIFLEYSIDWNTKIMSLSVHVVTDANHSTSSIANNQLSGIQIFDIYNIVKSILMDLSSETTTKLKLIAERPAEADVVNYQIIDFNCIIEEQQMEDKYKEGVVETIKQRSGLKYST
ncbi:MAG: hypothetical protein N4A49_01855 [Marinifilaceae bacterium]|jgi:hypothetical protein|nr:hypothetical protein [Marinifilaceae bacterium]